MESPSTIAHIHAILATIDPRLELLQVTKPSDGIVNDVRFLETSRAGFVLKIFDDASGTWKPQKESAVYSLMRGCGVPSPDVVAVDTSRRVVPFAYSLVERLDGDPYSHLFSSLTQEDHLGIYGQLGDYLGAMHSITFAKFGDIDGAGGSPVVGAVHELDRGTAGMLQGPFSRWLEMHQEIVRTRLNLMRGTEFDDLVADVERYFDDRQGMIDGDITPRLLHMDLHQGNILIRDGRVVGLLDVEESMAGHHEYDLMRTELALFRGEDPAFEQVFLDAYTRHVPLDGDYQLRKSFYDVSRTLAWIRSLILHRAGGTEAQVRESRLVARSHLVMLLQVG